MSGCHTQKLPSCKHGFVDHCNECDNPVSPIIQQMQKLEERICCLELELKAKEFKADMNKDERWMECLAGVEKSFNQRLEKSEKTIEELVTKIANIANYCYRQKKAPHSCPVCQGKGNILNIHPNDMYFRQDCRACDAKGILWG